MKKMWFKGLSLSFACLLGVGGLIGVIHSSKSNDVIEAKAASEVLWKTFKFSDTFLSSIEEANAVDGFWITWSIEGTGNTAAMQDGALHMHVVEPGGRNVFDLRYRIPTDVEICKIEVDAIPGLDGNGVGGRNQNFSIQGNLDGAYADRQYIQRSGSSSATTKSTFTFTPKEDDGPNILNQISLKLGTETKNRNTQYTFDTYFWEMRFYKAVYSQPVTITAGTGVQSVYLSENSTATSGSASGTNYDIGKTVYGFATIQTGYSAPSGWAKVSGSTYRVGSKTVGESGADFGTVNATLDTYSIQYTLNGGSVSGNPTSYNVNSNAFTLKNPIKTGYTFDGWSGTGISGKSTSVTVNKGSTGNRSYTANWTANTYTVRYNTNKPANATGNVTGVPGNATWTYDSNATLGSAPSLPGWTFGGWYKEASCTNKLGNAGATLTKPNLRTTSGTYDLYAKWTANQYTLVYNGNGRPHAPASYEVTDVPANATWTYDDPTEVNFGAAPTYGEGYMFDGWYREAECTNKVANAGESITKANLSSVSGGTVNLFAKWIFTDEVQAVIDEILKTRTSTYQELPNQIDVADAAYDALSDALKAVIISEGYKTILENAHEVEAVGELIDALGTAEDTPEWRAAVEEARDAYEELDDKTFNALNPILNVLENDEAAVAVMDIINNIGDPHWTSESKTLIDVANNAYETYIDAGKPEEQIANYETLQYANECYANVQTFVDKVNAITNNPFEYTDACKALIDEARRYYKEELDAYQKGLATSDASTYYELLVNYENAWNAMYLIDQINDMENDPACGEKIKAARDAVSALDKTTELPLMRADLLKELNDKEAAWGVMKLINVIYPMVYGEDCENAIEAARTAYNALEDDQEQFVVNYNMLTKAEEDYAAVEAVVAEVAALGEIRYDEESLEKIEHARDAYEALSEDQKGFYPDFSLEDIGDYETAYEALDKIYNIGEISYNTESENKISEAREFYESLTEEQKELINEKDYEVLIVSETEYARQKKNATILVIIMLILACLVILGGIWFLFFLLKRKKKDDDDDEQKGNKKPVKAMSVTGLFPIILTSHFLDAPYIALYVLAGIGVLLWISILVIAIMKKKQVGPFKKKEEVAKVKTQASMSSEDEEVETISDEKGNIFQIRYIKSFTAKLIQSPEETKKYYEELKNEVLSYKKTNSRVSWHYDAINSGREYVLKFAIRGKTLCVYLQLNPEGLEEKYKVEKVENKRFEDVPCLYRIKNDRRCEYAKELIALAASNLGLEKGEEQHEVYSNLPYEPNKPLVARGLIKEQKVQVNKPAEQQVLKTKVSSDGDEIVVTKDEKGNIFEIRYIKSFTAKLSQSEKEVKDYYTVLKNYALSYKEAHSRVSWHYDAINVGRDYVIKFAMRGKTLCVYFALEASKLDEKYKVEEAKGKKYEEVPTLYRIKNDRRCEYAKELIDEVMKKAGASQGEIPTENYAIPHESTKALLAKGLIKELKTAVKKKEVHRIDHLVASVSVDEADKLMSDEDAEVMIEEDKSSKKHEGKKAIVNIDELEANFNNGDKVTLEVLKEKKLIAKDVGRVKLLARGQLDKKLDVHLQEYSIQAVKMILLVGGKVQKAK